jgi:hypothetical protein
MRNPGKTLGSRQKVLEEKLPHLKQVGKHDSQIVSTEKEIIEFSKLGGLVMFNIHKTYFFDVLPKALNPIKPVILHKQVALNMKNMN